MELNKNKCTGMEERLADLLLDPDAAPENVTIHVAECDDCHRQLEELRAAMALLDAWEAPEPNPYFMTRFEARMREERKAAPAGWLERLKARILLGPHMHARPLAAMALTVLLLLGGGAYLGVTNWEQPVVPDKDAAVVHDLQTLDSNAQLLDQLESLSGNDADDLNQN
ncbi:MAG TPA: hypothetical protein VGG85_17170 [Terracidiphilus sp.]|jgi:hypothetical protein